MIQNFKKIFLARNTLSKEPSMSQADDLVYDIVSGIKNDPQLGGQPWDSYVVIVQIVSGKTKLNGYRYIGGNKPLPSTVRDNNLYDLFENLQKCSASKNGETWKVAVLKIDHESGKFNIDFYYGKDAEFWRVNPSTYVRIAEAVRPKPEDFGLDQNGVS